MQGKGGIAFRVQPRGQYRIENKDKNGFSSFDKRRIDRKTIG